MAFLDNGIPDLGWLSPNFRPLASEEGKAQQADEARELAAQALARRMRRQSPVVPPPAGKGAAADEDTGTAWPAGGSSPAVSMLTPGAMMGAPAAPAAEAPQSQLLGANEPVPLPRPQPASQPGNPSVTVPAAADEVSARATASGPPLDLLPQAIPGGAAPPPPSSTPAGPATSAGPLDKFGNWLTNNSSLLMALGAGMTGAPSIGTGISRALTNAGPVAQQNQTINALVAKGMPMDVARAAASNPAILQQLIPSMFGPKQLKFAQIGEDMMGNKRFGFVDEVHGHAYDVNGKPLQQGTPGGAGNIPLGADGLPLQGKELMTHLEKSDPIAAAGVKSVLAGDINAGTRNLQKLLPLAALVEPGFSQQTYQTRLATMKDFTPQGVSGKNLTAISTGLGHADRLMQAVDKLGNFSIMPGVANPVYNAVRGQLSPDYQAKVATYRQDVNAVSGELAKAFRSTGMSEADIQAWRKSFDENSSPATMRAAATEAIHLLDSRLEAIGASYNRGMSLSSNKPAPELLSPEGRRVHAKLLGLEAPEGATAPSASSAAPAAAPKPGKYMFDPASKRMVPMQ